jgi:hypothetical protein
MWLMRAPRDLHRTSTRLLSTALLVVGVAMIVVTVANGGGPLATGVLLGLLFTAAGAGRLWVASRG